MRTAGRVAQPSRKRGKDVLMVMKMAKSTPVLINGGSFCARNLLAGTLGISILVSVSVSVSSTFSFASLFIFPAAALTSLTFFSNYYSIQMHVEKVIQASSTALTARVTNKYKYYT